MKKLLTTHSDIHIFISVNTTSEALQLSRKAESVAELLKLMAHPLRMKVLCRLAQGECSVGDLVEGCGAPQPTISQVLSLMRAEGLVSARREGRFIHYRIDDPRIGHLMKALKKIFCDD
jgi:DNA-binding transcriptional ArsR family regulator